MPIYSASFLGASSGKVVASGRRPFFYLYDTVAGKLDQVPKIVGRARQEKSLERCVASPDGRTIAFCGNDGYIILYDAHNKRWITDLKVNGSVRAICFTPGGGEHHHVMASGSDGDVYRWDLRNSRRPCIERFSNQDGTITSCLAASSQQFAVGAESGVVNLYASHQAPGRGSSGSGMSAVLASAGRTPVKSILNLHTSADMVRFNGDGQILAMSTRRERQNNNSLKLLHVPTATVFSNWPTSKTPLGYVWSMDFSPQSKFLAIGNDKGKCLLYRLNHYHYMDN
jgi:U3 small nucleolar RNA-associated protein 18